MQTDKIKWFWAHRRNASLHHFSFLMHGLRNQGWLPEVDFSFDNQLVVGVPGKGCYVFYDKDQLCSRGKYADVQRSIDSNPNFAADFHRKHEEVFNAIFAVCDEIETANLPSLSNTELAAVYRRLLDRLMVGPIITVQLWGIEACFDPNYKIMRFLEKKLADTGRTRELQQFKELLAVNTGETVAFTEQKDFFTIAMKMDIPQIRRLLVEESIDVALEQFKVADPQLYAQFLKHTKEYAWVNTEYVGGEWTTARWLELFKKAVLDQVSAAQKLKSLVDNFAAQNKQRTDTIAALNPPTDVRNALQALAEFIARRDWSKGHFTKALLSYQKMLNEIARRSDSAVNAKDLLFISYPELLAYLNSGLGKNFFDASSLPAKAELADRQQNGFIILIKHGELSLITGKEQIRKTIEVEGVSEPFDKIAAQNTIKGLGASRGVYKGPVRVVETAGELGALRKGEILVTYMTTIEFTPAFRTAAAVITDEGGMSCHAAIISREFRLPCVVGTKIATRALRTGDIVELDGATGVIKIS